MKQKRITQLEWSEIKDRYSAWESFKDMASEYWVSEQALYMRSTREQNKTIKNKTKMVGVNIKVILGNLKYCKDKWYLNEFWESALVILKDIIN